MKIFIKDVKISKMADAFDMSDHGKKVFGLWIDVKEPKNELEFQKAVKVMHETNENEYEVIALISDNFYAFKYDYISYSDGKYFAVVSELKEGREELKGGDFPTGI